MYDFKGKDVLFFSLVLQNFKMKMIIPRKEIAAKYIMKSEKKNLTLQTVYLNYTKCHQTIGLAKKFICVFPKMS